jgi:Ca2+-binding EF-hand superfamily protein
VDVNHDGLISYEEFLPLCFDLFVEIWQDKYMEASGTGNALEEQFMALFKQNDPEGSEKISAVDLRALLGTWGMSPMQVETTMAEAQIGGDGCVVYPKFARICAQYASAFFQGMPPQATKAYQDMGEDETDQFLRNLFTAADVDRSGALDESEFVALIKGSGLNLPRKAIFKIMEEADANDDGLIQYDEFVEMMVGVIQSQKKTKETEERMQELEARAFEEAEWTMTEGVPREDVEKMIFRMFKAADRDGNGHLSRAEFVTAMQELDFGLSKKEIRALMSQLDKNADGRISYEEFVPLAVEILVELTKEKILEDPAAQSKLTAYFREQFGEADSSNSGRLSCNAIRGVLQHIGMSALEIEGLLSTAVVDAAGTINYKKFSRTCAEYGLEFKGTGAVSSLSIEKRKARCISLFERLDLDGSGLIDHSEMESYIKRLAAKFRHDLPEAELLKHCERFKTKPVNVDQFTEYIVDTYDHIDDEHFFGFLDYCDTPSYFARVRRLRTLFWKLDTDGSGFVEMDEKRGYMKKLATKFGMAVTDQQIDELVCDFAFIDRNCDGKITEDEFITAFLEYFEMVDDEEFLKGLGMFDVRTEEDRAIIFSNMFRRHDLDNDGFLDAREVRTYFQKFGEKMGHHMQEDELSFAISQFMGVDANGDGKVSKEEFVQYFMNETSNVSDDQFYDQIEFFDA